MNDLASYISHNWIAVLSLALSIYVVFRERKTITVTWQKNAEMNYIDGTFVFLNNNESRTYSKVIFTSIEVVNPSPEPIGFFDLRVFDPHTNANIEFLTERTLPIEVTSKHVYRWILIGNELRYVQLDIPKRKFGTFPANSFTRIDIAAVIKNTEQHAIPRLANMAVSFKVAKRALLFHDRFSVTNRKLFKSFRFIYDIKGFESEWQELPKAQNNPEKHPHP